MFPGHISKLSAQAQHTQKTHTQHTHTKHTHTHTTHTGVRDDINYHSTLKIIDQ